MSITSMEDLKNKQAEVKKNLDGYTCRVLVCSGTGCIASGAQKIYEEMSRLCEGIEGVAVEMQKDVPHVGIVKTGCQGLCELGPLMRIEPYDYQYVHVQVDDCRDLSDRFSGDVFYQRRLSWRHAGILCVCYYFYRADAGKKTRSDRFLAGDPPLYGTVSGCIPFPGHCNSFCHGSRPAGRYPSGVCLCKYCLRQCSLFSSEGI